MIHYLFLDIRRAKQRIEELEKNGLVSEESLTHFSLILSF